MHFHVDLYWATMMLLYKYTNNQIKRIRYKNARVMLLIGVIVVPLLDSSFNSMMQQSSLQTKEHSSFSYQSLHFAVIIHPCWIA